MPEIIGTQPLLSQNFKHIPESVINPDEYKNDPENSADPDLCGCDLSEPEAYFFSTERKKDRKKYYGKRCADAVNERKCEFRLR